MVATIPALRTVLRERLDWPREFRDTIAMRNASPERHVFNILATPEVARFAGRIRASCRSSSREETTARDRIPVSWLRRGNERLPWNSRISSFSSLDRVCARAPFPPEWKLSSAVVFADVALCCCVDGKGTFRRVECCFRRWKK